MTSEQAVEQGLYGNTRGRRRLELHISDIPIYDNSITLLTKKPLSTSKNLRDGDQLDPGSLLYSYTFRSDHCGDVRIPFTEIDSEEEFKLTIWVRGYTTFHYEGKFLGTNMRMSMLRLEENREHDLEIEALEDGEYEESNWIASIEKELTL